MRAVLTETSPGLQGLELGEVPDPVPGPGQLLLDVAAAGVNRADLLQRAGHYPPPPGAPPRLGLEVSGVVAGLGPGLPGPQDGGWTIGQEVCALLAGGGYAQKVAVDARLVLPVPASVGLVDAASLPEAACTAWSNLVDVGGLRAGQTVLVHGGSGGVGSIAVQLAAALGARVLTTAGGPDRVRRCRELGADVVLDHREPDLTRRVLDATGGRGVDLVLDVLGAGSLRANLEVLAPDGRLVVIGLQQGTRAEIDLGLMLARRITLAATTLRSRPDEQKAAIVAAVRTHVWPMVADGRVRPLVHDRIPLSEAARAHDLLASGDVFGKLLLLP